MAEENITTKEELLAAIDRDWLALQAVLGRMDMAQMTGVHDAEGWNVKDHLVHLAAWERSVVCFLQGKARHIGLGVDENTYLRDDGINAAIYRQAVTVTPQQALEDLHTVHQQLLALLQPLSDEDLHQPYRHYLPEEPAEGDGPPAINVVYWNTADHFREHLGWMAALLAKGQPM